MNLLISSSFDTISTHQTHIYLVKANDRKTKKGEKYVKTYQ